MVALFLWMPLLYLYRIRLIGLGHRCNGVGFSDGLSTSAHSATALTSVSSRGSTISKLGIDAWACACGVEIIKTILWVCQISIQEIIAWICSRKRKCQIRPIYSQEIN